MTTYIFSFRSTTFTDCTISRTLCQSEKTDSHCPQKGFSRLSFVNYEHNLVAMLKSVEVSVTVRSSRPREDDHARNGRPFSEIYHPDWSFNVEIVKYCATVRGPSKTTVR